MSNRQNVVKLYPKNGSARPSEPNGGYTRLAAALAEMEANLEIQRRGAETFRRNGEELANIFGDMKDTVSNLGRSLGKIKTGPLKIRSQRLHQIADDWVARS